MFQRPVLVFTYSYGKLCAAGVIHLLYPATLSVYLSTVTPDAILRPGRQLLPPRQSVWVAKVGITENPAERLYDIFNAFQEFGESQPLLGRLSRSDDPQTAVAKAKSMNEIILIEKVHTSGNAEHDIRAILQLQAGQPKLPQGFFDSFAASVPKEKKSYLEVVGMTEWILMKDGLIGMLQQKFHGGGIHDLGFFGKVPNGEELTHAVNDFCDKYCKIASSRGPTRDSFIGGPRPPLVITFKATKFTYNIIL